jgi:hypothetical protein
MIAHAWIPASCRHARGKAIGFEIGAKGFKASDRAPRTLRIHPVQRQQLIQPIFLAIVQLHELSASTREDIEDNGIDFDCLSINQYPDRQQFTPRCIMQ